MVLASSPVREVVHRVLNSAATGVCFSINPQAHQSDSLTMIESLAAQFCAVQHAHGRAAHTSLGKSRAEAYRTYGRRSDPAAHGSAEFLLELYAVLRLSLNREGQDYDN
jgi:hypothetical protein